MRLFGGRRPSSALLYRWQRVASFLVVVALGIVCDARDSFGQVPTCNGLTATIIGTDGADLLRGTAGDDVIDAGAGNDTVQGRGGNDTICGGPGDDLLIGGRGDDHLDGGMDADQLRGEAGNDTLRGGEGRDVAIGGRGNDVIDTGDGDDKARGDAGDDLITGGPGRDLVVGGRGQDRCSEGETTRECEGAPSPDALALRATADRFAGVAGTQFRVSASTVDPTVDVQSWLWALEDGRTFVGQEVELSFDAPGVYAPTVTATTVDGRTGTKQLVLSVFGPASQSPPGLGLPPLLGDVNADAVITLEDAYLVQKHVSDLERLVSPGLDAADFDLDGSITERDARLLGRAVLGSSIVPSAVVPARGAPGTRVQLVSPALLDPAATVEVEVGASGVVQNPTRIVLGFSTIVIPFDVTTPGSIVVSPGPIEIRVKVNGVVQDRLRFDLEAPDPLPADPSAYLLEFLSDFESLLAMQETVATELADGIGLTGEPRDEFLLTSRAIALEALDSLEKLQAAVAADSTGNLARLVLLLMNANGLEAYRSSLEAFLLSAGQPSNLVALAGSDPVCDVLVPQVCEARRYAKALSEGVSLVGVACDAAQITALIAAIADGALPIGDVALVGLILACTATDTALSLGDFVFGVLGDADTEMALTAMPQSPAAGQASQLRGTITVIGLDDVCTKVGTSSSDFIREALVAQIVKKLLRKYIPGALLNQIPADWLKDISAAIASRVGASIDALGVADRLANFYNVLCVRYEVGKPLPFNMSMALTGPEPNVGTLEFDADGKVANYMCPTAMEQPDPPVTKVRFTLSKVLCDVSQQKEVDVNCAVRPVTITIGDNGSLLDDIFEASVGDQTLTSSNPVRSTSKVFELPVGEHTVLLSGRAAPDGVGTYFISFQGATVVSGAAQSGSDLTPGVTKSYRIRVD